MNLKLKEQIAKIEEDIFSYFEIPNPHPEVIARVLSSHFELIDFINPTSTLEHKKASTILLKSDHNNRWGNLFSKLDYINDDIFINIITQASNTTVLTKKEDEERPVSVCAFYEERYHPEFLDKLCQNEMIKSYVEDLKSDPTKIKQLCEENFYFFIFANNFNFLDKSVLKEVFLNYYNGTHNITEAQETFPNSDSYKLAKISVAFFENFNATEINQMLKSYFSYYLKGSQFEKISPYLSTQAIIENFVEHSNKFFSTQYSYNTTDYKANIINLFRVLHHKGANTEICLDDIFNQVAKKHGADLIYIFLDELLEEHFKPVTNSLLKYIQPKNVASFLQKKNIYSKHIESLNKLPESFWDKVKKDKIAYIELFEIFKKMDEHSAKSAYSVIPFIFKTEDAVMLINEYLNNYPKEMFRFPIFETLLETKSLDDKLYTFIQPKLDDSWNIQDTVMKTIIKNMKKDSTYIKTYHQEIGEILDMVFDQKAIKRFFHDYTNYVFNFDFSNLLVDEFPHILLNNFSPNNDENFLLIQKKPIFLDTPQEHSNDIQRIKLQNFYWQQRSREFNEIFSSILQKEWEKNLEKNPQKEEYQKYYFEHAVIKEVPKVAKKLKI